MKFIIRILKAIRYFIVFVGLFFLTIPAAPIIMIFKWDKLWLLLIATEEDCSLEEAKRLSETIPKYKFSRWNFNFPNCHAAGIARDDFVIGRSDDGFETNKTTDPTYSYLPQNIFYSDYHK